MLTLDAARKQLTLKAGYFTAAGAVSSMSAPRAADRAAPAMPPVGRSGTTRDARAVPSAPAQGAVPAGGPVALLRTAGAVRHRCVLPWPKPGAVAVTPPEETRC